MKKGNEKSVYKIVFKKCLIANFYETLHYFTLYFISEDDIYELFEKFEIAVGISIISN